MKMKTRSQTKLAQFEVIIDFDEASLAWNSNKKKLNNGCYQYICCAINKNGNNCSRKSMNNCDYCHNHKKFCV
jgi:hypothetical protein